MSSVISRLFAVRSVDSILKELDAAPPMNRVLTARSLTAIGLGSTIGAGVFVFTGQVAAQNAGPALTLALLIAAIGSGFAAICYAEFAAMIPVSGSAYTYTYATLGEALAWIVGWNLALEYMMSASAVAVSWSGYVVNLIGEWGVQLPEALVKAPLGKAPEGGLQLTGAILNVPAVAIIALLGWVCYVGVRQSSAANTVMVFMKAGIIVVFILAGIAYVDTSNWQPYIPPNTGKFGEFGWSGVLQGAGIIFFSYIGFDAASTTAREARNPRRDVPLGILSALGISTVLYLGMAMVMTGMVPYALLDVPAPVAVALDAHPQLGWLGGLVKIGAIAGLTSVVLMSLLGQPRILLSMAEDGLLPKTMSAIHPRYRTPHVATVWTVVFAALIAGFFPLDILGEMISMGILLAFAMVCIGVLVLRHRRPEMPRPFRVPLAPLTCLLGTVFCGGMAYFLPNGTWWRLAIWTALGLLIYGLYGYRNSRLRKHTPEELNMRPHPPEVVPASSASGYDLRPLNAAEREAYAASLSNEERHVILHQGTERAFGGALLHNKASGIYACRLCGLPLYKASTKFESGSGWPSFFQPFDDLHVREVRDTSHGMTRVEIRCRRCDGHLGHVFDDGPAPTHKRHCLNSVSLQFVPEGEEPAQRVAGAGD